jgi:hypothetical protein
MTINRAKIEMSEDSYHPAFPQVTSPAPVPDDVVS